MSKWVRTFSENLATTPATERISSFSNMVKMGVPIPPGFMITLERHSKVGDRDEPQEGLWREIRKALDTLQQQTGKIFGDAENPLLLSAQVISGLSRPSELDSVFNLGLNETTAVALQKLTGDATFAWQTYCSFLRTFGERVLNIAPAEFQPHIDMMHIARQYDAEEVADSYLHCSKRIIEVIRQESNLGFPEDPFEQVRILVMAFFRSWTTQQTIDQREDEQEDKKQYDDLVIAIQTVVLSNVGEDSAIGACFTRNPITGQRQLYGEYSTNTRADEMVAGLAPTKSIEELKHEVPALYEELEKIARVIEAERKEMLDLEYVVERGKLWVINSQIGSRSPNAAVQVAVDLALEGVISEKQAVERVSPEVLAELHHSSISELVKSQARSAGSFLASGLPASPGAAIGRLALDIETAKRFSLNHQDVILARMEITPEDLNGILEVQGLLTVQGGITSHGAVIARSVGKPYVAGARAITLDYIERQLTLGSEHLNEGDFLTLDGNTGEIFAGELSASLPVLSDSAATLLNWADKYARMPVRANADTPEEAQIALQRGARGIGLCRTEHMFSQENRIEDLRAMILADNADERLSALSSIEALQIDDFVEIFTIMNGMPVTIRTLDLPLYEFLPRIDEEYEPIAERIGVSSREIANRAEKLREVNPMLGFRGCRLGIAFPEITEMQARAIFSAAIICCERGIDVSPEIMIPLVVDAAELQKQIARISTIASQLMNDAGVEIQYTIGAMIELPRAALTADKLARFAQFFSFGTNDLTQMTFGMSRDDTQHFLPLYLKAQLLERDPFVVLDEAGVGELVKIGVERGRAVNSTLPIGVCGEHAGEPTSIYFFNRIGVSYVSCSPDRIPIARLAAAQSALKSSAN
jgi:pyruvate,orthophosphate dikinase